MGGQETPFKNAHERGPLSISRQPLPIIESPWLTLTSSSQNTSRIARFPFHQARKGKRSLISSHRKFLSSRHHLS